MPATEDRGDANAAPASRMSRVLKWVGAATAVISLILGARQLIGIATDRAQRSRDSAEFTALARQQADRGEFAEAWQSLDRAEQRSRTPELASARLDIAFRWLEEGRPGAGQPFTSITDAVTPALDRALLDPKDPRRADVLAHMGWATFLKSRETGTGDPAALYKQALAIDPHNVYANVMLAHWMIWQGEPLTAARPYFDQAVAAGKERALVRTFQLAALRNRNDDRAEAEMIRVVASMREQNEPVDDRSARATYVAFRHRYGPNAPPSDPSVVGIAAAEQLATFKWLTQKPGISERPDVDTAIITTLTKLMSHS